MLVQARQRCLVAMGSQHQLWVITILHKSGTVWYSIISPNINQSTKVSFPTSIWNSCSVPYLCCFEKMSNIPFVKCVHYIPQINSLVNRCNQPRFNMGYNSQSSLTLSGNWNQPPPAHPFLLGTSRGIDLRLLLMSTWWVFNIFRNQKNSFFNDSRVATSKIVQNLDELIHSSSQAGMIWYVYIYIYIYISTCIICIYIYILQLLQW